MDLTSLAFCNLNFLLDLEKDDVVLTNRRNLYKQDEFVQVENIQELEHTFYFTFNHLLNTNHKYDINIKELLDDIDIAIENVYENTTINKLLEDDEDFDELLKDIDNRFHDVKEKYLKRSICSRLLDRFVTYSEMMGEFMRVSNLVFSEYNSLEDTFIKEKVNPETGETNPNLIYSDDELSDSNDDNNDSDDGKKND